MQMNSLKTLVAAVALSLALAACAQHTASRDSLTPENEKASAESGGR